MERHFWRRTVCLGLSAAMTASLFLFPAAASEVEAGTEGENAQQGGLYLTEIYPNDINREGVYGNGSDHMEFVEVSNTSQAPVTFSPNGGYTLWYEYNDNGTYKMKQLAVAALDDGSETFEIAPGETVVFWSRRSDMDNTATEAEFRAAWHVPEDVKIYDVSGQDGFAEDDRGFALKDPEGNVVSHYRYYTGVDTSDGLGVDLQVPDDGAEMVPLRQQTYGTPGTIYRDQRNQDAAAPSEQTVDHLIITEIRPNDSNRDADYGSEANDMMEAVEIYNPTDTDVDFNASYQLGYIYKASIKPQTVSTVEDAHRMAAGEEITESAPVVIPAHSAAVIWCYREKGLEGQYDRFPTEAEFRAAYGIPEEVPVYAQTGQSGWGNTYRGLALLEKTPEGGDELVSFYFWNGSSDLKDNKSVDLRVSEDGPRMSILTAQSNTSLGVVKEQQYTFAADDGSYPTLRLWEDTEISPIAEGQFLRIPYYYAGTDVLPVKEIDLYYRMDGEGAYTKAVATSFSIYNKYYAFIDNAELLGHDSVEYYLVARNEYRSTRTDTVTVPIVRDDAADGLRVNYNGTQAREGQTLSGTVQITGKDFARTGEPVTFAVDGVQQESTAALERYAYFTFDYNGVDSYFKNALTHGEEVLGLFAKCSEIPAIDSLAIPVGEQYFTYAADGSATVALSLYAGTYGSTFESDTAANNDDFTTWNYALHLTDGTVLFPTSIKNASGEDVSRTDPVKMGDSSGCTIRLDLTFELPAGSADAQAFALDTTALTDGTHTLTASCGEAQQTFSFLVDNSAPVQPEEPFLPLGEELSVSVSGNSATASISGEGSTAALYQAENITVYTVKDGAGDSTYTAQARTSFGSVTSDNGEYPYEILEIPVDAAQGGQLRLDMTADSDYGQPVQVYLLDTASNDWVRFGSEDLAVNEADGHLTAVLPIQAPYVNESGVMTVLLQARGAEFDPTTAQDMHVSAPAAAEWDGTAVPEEYDFSIAWISDTQYYAEQWMDNFASLTDYILAERENLGIEYVIHTGDIVDEFNEEYEFQNASKELKKFEDAGLPYGVLGGNHDVAHGNERYGLYWKYFGADRYEGFPWYGGSYENNLGHYDLVSVDGQELLFIYMSWDIYTDEVEWINSVLEQYPERTAIICIHGGINASAVPSYQSELLMEQVAKTHENVLAILNGHFHGSSLNFVGVDDDGDGTDDRVVYQICTDYQSAPEGGDGYFKMIYFDLTNKKIYMNSYSPVQKDFNYYDTPKLDSYGAGTVAYDIDITELDVDFDTETSKTLSLSGLQVYQLTESQLGADAALENGGAQIAFSAGDVQYVYARLTDAAGQLRGITEVAEVRQTGGDSGSDSGSSSGGGVTQYTITASAGAGGTISPLGTVRVNRGADRTFTITAEEGYVIDDVLVDGRSVGAVSTYTFENVRSGHTIAARFTAADSDIGDGDTPLGGLPFADVSAGAWYAEAVEYVYSNGVMQGISDASFAPGQNLTRGMIAQILYNLEGSPAGASGAAFTDVSAGAWYAGAVNWAAAQGIVSGYDAGHFGPEDSVTREQLASILYRYAQYKGYQTASSETALQAFADGGTISDWAVEAMTWAVSDQVLSGKDGGTLDPQGTATRAEVAQMMMNFLADRA